MGRAYVMLAMATFACYLTVSAAAEEASFTIAQGKTYTTTPPTDPVPDVPTTPTTTPACPPPPASPGTCSFWSKAHPSSLPDIMSFITPILSIFGSGSGSTSSSTITSIFGAQMTLHQGLTNTRPDAYGALLRQGSAAVLNSYTARNFVYTPVQVKTAFRGALVSQQAASVMATKFENANLGYGRRN